MVIMMMMMIRSSAAVTMMQYFLFLFTPPSGGCCWKSFRQLFIFHLALLIAREYRGGYIAMKKLMPTIKCSIHARDTITTSEKFKLEISNMPRG